jgi:hypothetical protein
MHGSGISHFAWFFENFITKCGGKTDVMICETGELRTNSQDMKEAVS